MNDKNNNLEYVLNTNRTMLNNDELEIEKKIQNDDSNNEENDENAPNTFSSLTEENNVSQFKLLDNKKKTSEREENFRQTSILCSTHHPFTINNKSSYFSYFYTNTNIILNKFVMSYEEQLHKAIRKGNIELCRELLIKKCDINAEYENKSPLSLACEQNNYDIAELLIKSGANINQIECYEQTCLIHAVSSAELSLVKLLIENGADLNRSDCNGCTPLHIAANRKNDEICDYLLSQGASINLIDKQGCTALAMAISNDYVYMVNRLLSLGADPNISDNNGDTPLIKAIWETMSSNLNQDQINYMACQLIDYGADVDAQNENGRTALFTSIYQNCTDIALYLLEKGAKCDLQDSVLSNFTLLHYACFQGNYTLTKALLERNCDPNSIATSCESPVYIAVTKGYLDIVGLLVEYKADVNLMIGTDCDNKCTALQASVYYISDYEKFKGIVDKLIEGNVDLSVSQPGPILFICLQYNKVNFAKYLLSVGSNVKQRTIFNQSCFYKAFLLKNLEFMQLCVLMGFCLYDEPWISEYLDNPDFINYTDYYVRRVINSGSNSDESSEESDDFDAEDLSIKTDQEINDLLNLDEYFFDRFHIDRRKVKDKKRENELAVRIFSFIKYYYTNPMSLKELARVKIRNCLLKNDYKMKIKIERNLNLPKRIKDYLLFKEFNL